jgi:hypothetical protein
MPRHVSLKIFLLREWSCELTRRRDPPRDEVRRETERTSSPRPQITQQNRSAGEARSARRGLCFARPHYEHTIWQSEMRLKGASRGLRRAALCPRHVYGGHLKRNFQKIVLVSCALRCPLLRRGHLKNKGSDNDCLRSGLLINRQ